MHHVIYFNLNKYIKVCFLYCDIKNNIFKDNFAK